VQAIDLGVERFFVLGQRTLAIVLVSCSPAFAQSTTTCRDADLVIHNGKIVALDDRATIAQAMAVRDGKIVVVGTDAESAACAGPATRRVDLGGKTVLPGLIDVHTHAQSWAKNIVRGAINGGAPDITSIADIVALVKARAAQSKPGDWIIGFGWNDSKLADHRYIRASDLDPVSPNNPVYLDHVSGHLAAANSVALKLAGITRDTPDPQGGVIERDANGEATGIVKDTAMPLVGDRLPLEPPDVAAKAAQFVSRAALAVGLTTIHDIGLSPDDMRGYQEARSRGWLGLRVQMVPLVRNLSDAEQLLKTGVHTGFGDDRLKFGGVKFFSDGGMGARTIAIYPPSCSGSLTICRRRSSCWRAVDGN
jgi:predicted amidohydrolase YtcJ